MMLPPPVGVVPIRDAQRLTCNAPMGRLNIRWRIARFREPGVQSGASDRWLAVGGGARRNPHPMSRAISTSVAADRPDSPRPPSAPGHDAVIEIVPAAPGFAVVLAELWQFRHLFSALVWRNVRVEFDATRLGSAWAIARPILFTLVF